MTGHHPIHAVCGPITRAHRTRATPAMTCRPITPACLHTGAGSDLSRDARQLIHSLSAANVSGSIGAAIGASALTSPK